MLVVLCLAKLLATSLVLATGWKGGYIFPIMFASVALGLATNLMFPGIPVAVAVAATMAGALVAALNAPLFAALLTITLVQRETAPRSPWRWWSARCWPRWWLFALPAGHQTRQKYSPDESANFQAR